LAFRISSGGPLNFERLDYKTEPASDRVAKFHGDRLRELGDSVAKKRRKKTLAAKHKGLQRSYRSSPGGLNIIQL